MRVEKVVCEGGRDGELVSRQKFLAETPHCFLRQLMAPPQLPNTCVHTRSHLGPNLLTQPPLVFSSSRPQGLTSVMDVRPAYHATPLCWLCDPAALAGPCPLFLNYMATLQWRPFPFSGKRGYRGSVLYLQGWSPTYSWQAHDRIEVLSLESAVFASGLTHSPFCGNHLSHKCNVTNHSEAAGKWYNDNVSWLMPPREHAQLMIDASFKVLVL